MNKAIDWDSKNTTLRNWNVDLMDQTNNSGEWKIEEESRPKRNQRKSSNIRHGKMKIINPLIHKIKHHTHKQQRTHRIWERKTWGLFKLPNLKRKQNKNGKGKHQGKTLEADRVRDSQPRSPRAFPKPCKDQSIDPEETLEELT